MKKGLLIATFILFFLSIGSTFALDPCKGLTEPACTITANCTWDMGLNGCLSDCFQFSGSDQITCETALGTGVCLWDSNISSCKPKFIAFAETCMNLNNDSIACDLHSNCDWEEFDLKCVIDCFQFDYTDQITCESGFGGDICGWNDLSGECNPAYFNPSWEGFSPCFEFDGNITGCQGMNESCVWMFDSYCTEGNPCYNYDSPADSGWCNPNDFNFGGGYQCYLYDGNKTGCLDVKENLGWTCDWYPDVWGPLIDGNESGWCNNMFSGSSGDNGCWQYSNEFDCGNAATMGMPCTWKNDSYSMNGGWCEQLGCWSPEFSANETNCVNDSADMGLNCGWDGSYCYEIFEGCSSFNNDEFGCYSTGWCIWDSFNKNCSEPVFTQTFYNPGCWIFDQAGQTKCENVNTCLWDLASSTCRGDGQVPPNGIQCENITDSIMCNNIPVLSTCCSWDGTTCNTAPYTSSCYQNIPMPPEGAMFCDDYKASSNQTLCELISGEPWYMPCYWNSTKSKCMFESDNFFGDFGSDFNFFDISSESTCQANGGVWHEEQWMDFNGNVQTDKWCEFGFGFGFETCDSACWACEFNDTGGEWNNLVEAQSACENSNFPDGCVFHSDSHAMNGYGWCDFNFTFNPLDFAFEDCFGFSDTDGDGWLPSEDPDCKDFLKFGYIDIEQGTECKDGLDNDGNGLVDCNDFGCIYDDYYCNTSAINDTSAPVITWFNAEKFAEGAMIMADTNKPTNATLLFYNDDATCTTVNNTILGPKLTNNFTKDDYDLWHDIPVDEYYFNKLGISFDFKTNTTYYYKVILCDKSGNCANSNCSSFKTRVETSQFFVGFKLPPPQNNTGDMLGMINVQFNWQGGSGNITGETGLQFNETDSRDINLTFTNPDADDSWSITFVGADFSSAQNINITDAFVANSSSGEILLGIKKNKWKEMAQKLGVDYIRITIPDGVTNSNLGRLKHCHDNATSPDDPSCIDINMSEVSCTFTASETICDIPTTIGFSVFAVFMAETIASSGGSSNDDPATGDVAPVDNAPSTSTTGSATESAGYSGNVSEDNVLPPQAYDDPQGVSDKTLVIIGVSVLIVGLALYLVTQLKKNKK